MSPTTRFVRTLVLSVFITSALLSPAYATCYFPDGTSGSGHFACGTGAASVCCAEGFQCLSNGFCNDQRYQNFQRVLRGGCTDKSWGSGCPGLCTSLWPQGDEAVFNCGSSKFCCGRTKSCCTDSSISKFDFGNPQVVAVAGKTMAQVTGAKEEEKTAPTTVASTSQKAEQTQAPPSPPSSSEKKEQQQQQQASTTSAQGEKTESTSAAGPKITDNASSTGRYNEEASQTSRDPMATVTLVHNGSPSAAGSTSTSTVTNNYTSAAPNNTLPIAIGVGVGVGVLLFLVVIGLFLLLKRRRRQKYDNEEIKNGATTYYEISDAGVARPGDAKKSWDWDGKDFGRGSGVLVELEGYRGVELDGGLGEAKEMDGSGVWKEGGKGLKK
ncbi:hypothetical protein CC80DRAFT_539436 [Byssothecium circinans]|uniref:Mid2 domain-containing protein n=1 Tax=Byssothecium circinans TaxID=147558 RepID=A0A6A5TD29_9PLEO|nr:hypothetical protein CC80DRAFT_539436 [Byssothecium circinans]